MASRHAGIVSSAAASEGEAVNIKVAAITAPADQAVVGVADHVLLGTDGLLLRPVAVLAPFEDVAMHVEEAEIVRQQRSYREGPVRRIDEIIRIPG